MLPPSKYPEPRRQAAFFREVVDRIASIPGVESAAGADSAPMLARCRTGLNRGPRAAAREMEIHAERPKIPHRTIPRDGIRLLRAGRSLGQITKTRRQVAMINEAAARQYWPNEDAMGKRVRLDDGGTAWRQVIGVVGDVRQDGLAKARRVPRSMSRCRQSPVPFMVLACGLG